VAQSEDRRSWSTIERVIADQLDAIGRHDMGSAAKVIYPLRRVVKRGAEGEVLECGHSHQNTYRQAKRRRCRSCVERPTSLETRVSLSSTPITSISSTPIASIISSTPTLEIDPPEASDQPRCAYCHDDLDQKTVTCQACRTILHQDCAKELGSCPTLKCPGKFQLSSTPSALGSPIQIKINLQQKSAWKRLVQWVSRQFIRFFCGLGQMMLDFWAWLFPEIPE
jgi:hypothetical protein